MKTKQRITNLGPNKNIISYIDDTKKSIQCIHSTPVFDKKKNYNCMWCTFPVIEPIGCPYKKVEKKVLKKFYNGNEELKQVENEENKNEYLTDGVFCSFNCAKAFILNHAHNSFYRHSERLLANMYLDLIGEKSSVTIISAPHYRNLAIFGGEMSEYQFKQSFDKLIYNCKGKINMYSVSVLFEETGNM